ncbi:MAG TPA: YdeI/OmpD-associated family protein [Candidatus Sulfotelmatobacter sp.]|nr:YdeI/OmpD-associated family protein [Candidatus Sulfotelmatobacter sp.]
MAQNKPNPKVDIFLKEAEHWRAEFTKLRAIALDCRQLAEELKWGKPCYSFEGTNIVVIQGFKEYCALLFTKGALMKDPDGILIQQTENVQAARQIRFTNLREITRMESILKAYIREAIEVEKSGLQVTYKKTAEFKVPEEFQNKLSENSALKAAFEALTPGRQRGYLLYFSAAKQSKTRESRIEKCMDLIFDGKGLNDDYKSERK